jgi:hypothetical protein
VFLTILVAFVSLIFVVFNDQTSIVRTFLSTLETSFLIILGKFNTTAFSQSQPTIGPLICVAYNLAIVFILANFMITIITGYYSDAKKDYIAEKGNSDSLLFEYAKNKLNQFLKSFDLSKSSKYLDRKHMLNDMESCLRRKPANWSKL